MPPNFTVTVHDVTKIIQYVRVCYILVLDHQSTHAGMEIVQSCNANR